MLLVRRAGARTYYDSGKSPEFNRLAKAARRTPRRSPPRHADEEIPSSPTLPQQLNPSYAELDPVQQSKLRLHLMNSTARIPSPADLERAIPAWLAVSRKAESRSLQRAFAKVNLSEWRAAQLDEAWVWKRKEEQLQGITGTPADRLEDAQVAERQQARALDAQPKRTLRAPQTHDDRIQRLYATPEPPLRSLSGPERMLQQVLTSQRKLPPRDDSTTPLSYSRPRPVEAPPHHPPQWLLQRQALQNKFPEGWAPPKRLSREAISLVKLLQQSDPARYTTPILAEKFRISPEAVRRILKSKFELPADSQEKREAQRKLDKAKRAEQDDVEGVFKTSWAGDIDSERREMDRYADMDERQQDPDEYRSDKRYRN